MLCYSGANQVKEQTMLSLSSTTVIIAIFVFSLHHTKSLTSHASLSRCHNSFNCGALTNVSYPFTGGDRPSFCGTPQFQLSCHDGVPVLNISSVSYRVLQLDSAAHTLTLARLDLWNQTCTHVKLNSSFDGTNFSYGGRNQNLTLFYGCEPTSALTKLPDNLFHCESYGNRNYSYSLVGPFPVAPVLSVVKCDVRCDVSVEVPVLEEEANKLLGNHSLLGEVLMKGFHVNYSNPYDSECFNCLGSGGQQCGFDSDSNMPICICSDRLCHSSVSGVKFEEHLHTCGSEVLSYPFGFSSGNAIHLNCTHDNKISIGEFPVKSVTEDSIIVSIVAQCNRPFESFHQLFSHNYAPTSRNEILLQNCAKTMSPCQMPETLLVQQGCSGNMSCYSENNTRGFIRNKKLEEYGCESFWSSISSDALRNKSVSTVSMEMEMGTIELGWWLPGDCQCSRSAICTKLESPVDGRPGFRCRCKEGVVGDGFLKGVGCLQGSSNLNGRLLQATGVSMVGVVVIALFIWMFYFYNGSFSLAQARLVFKRTGSSLSHNVEDFIKSYASVAPRRYHYSEVENITNSFLDKLGQGGYGVVYKASLPDGRHVAVKIISESKGNGEEFINEVASISRTSHVNIVSLLGFCYERNRRALIYEYMPNGSLDKFIYKSGSQNAICNLDLSTLYQISIGIARGLEYLHRGCSTRILHLDIKPQNILLNEDYCPKIADFGLAKICKKKESIVSIMGIRGTPGYIAPEVYSRTYGGVSHKSDVYSYGMLILEVVGGRKNYDSGGSYSSEMYFPDWIYKDLEQGNIPTRCLTNTEEENDMVLKITLVSLWCIQPNPSDRPSMSKVVNMLEGPLQSVPYPPKPILHSPERLALPFSDISYSDIHETNSVTR